MIKATLKSTNNFKRSHSLLSKWQSLLLVVLLALPKTYNFFCVYNDSKRRKYAFEVRAKLSFHRYTEKKKAFTNP